MRLIIVSNRLPVTIIEQDNQLIMHQSIGGVATGLQAFLNNFKPTDQKEYRWIGWSGSSLSPNAQNTVCEKLAPSHYDPVFIVEALMEKFLAGFCNDALWPIFHQLPDFYNFDPDGWSAYQRVNSVFCQKLVEIIQPNDMVWIHDYHFLLLPKLLRQHFAKLAIGFFLHIPFPSPEILKVLPEKCRIALLNGLLDADLIGFHTPGYLKNFKEGIVANVTSMSLAKMKVYPMSIDFFGIHALAQKYNSGSFISSCKILKNFEGMKLILSVDRLDYIKGIPHKLLAYKKFLEQNPSWRNRVTLLLIVAPSRESIRHYQFLKEKIEGLVAKINDQFSENNWQPVVYYYKTFSPEELTELNLRADVAVITPLKDGMNLTAKEYIAAKINQQGVLILSENAGASEELMDAIIVNPYDEDNMVFALKTALEMPGNEQKNRLIRMQSKLKKQDVTWWGKVFIQDLLEIRVC